MAPTCTAAEDAILGGLIALALAREKLEDSIIEEVKSAVTILRTVRKEYNIKGTFDVYLSFNESIQDYGDDMIRLISGLANVKGMRR